MITKEFANQAKVRPSGEFELFEAIHGVEFSFKNSGEGFDSRASGADKSTVYIE
jgi:hypothetical protein